MYDSLVIRKIPPLGKEKMEYPIGGGEYYGQNEIIAAEIMVLTGMTRSRKQVSAHRQANANFANGLDENVGGSS